MVLNIGDQAPEFTLMSDANEKVSLKNFRGKKVILYFYPKDNTPGCIKEACNFRDEFNLIKQHNAEIIGISKDKPAKHKQFKQQYALPFLLLSDESADVCEAYGVINKKSLFGKSFLGIQRSTFLIDGKGIIRTIWPKVKVNGHVEEVIDELNKI